MEGKGHRSDDSSGQTVVELPREDNEEKGQEGDDIKERGRRTMTEVWGTELTRQSEHIKDQEAGNKVLLDKDSNKEAPPEVKIPRLTQMQSTRQKENCGKMPWTMS